jgi:hypothetical protein
MRRLWANKLRFGLVVGWLLVLAVLVAIALSATSKDSTGDVYHERFDETGPWGVYGTLNPEGAGMVDEGAYYMTMPTAWRSLWSLADGERFADGRYSVEVTQIDGPLWNGHGLIWRAEEKGSFYFFLISGDGRYAAGYCVNDCAGAEYKFSQGWQSSDAVHTGLDAVNTLAVYAAGEHLDFYINDQLVIQTDDPKFARGEIGLMLETYDEGDALVMFDNFRVEPLD